MTHWKRLWCWEGLGPGKEGDDRGWDGWMASLTQWTRVWVNSRSWWWMERPGVLQFMGLQRVGHNWMTELNWYIYKYKLMGNFCVITQWTMIRLLVSLRASQQSKSSFSKGKELFDEDLIFLESSRNHCNYFSNWNLAQLHKILILPDTLDITGS